MAGQIMWLLSFLITILNVKGVGSPRYGNMNEVVNTIEELGLIPQIKETICPVKEVGITEI